MDKRVIAIFLLILITCGLAMWQIRWGYFFALVFVMSLPFQFAVFRKPWVGWCVFAACLLPILKEWKGDLFPDDDRRADIQPNNMGG